MSFIGFKPLSNNLKKFVASLKDKGKRDQTGMFVAEGFRVCQELLESDYRVEFIVVSLNSDDSINQLAHLFLRSGIDVYTARRAQFDQITQTKTPQGILAVVGSPKEKSEFEFPIVVLDGISDPGNLGTIIRTIDWFGQGMVVCSEDSVDRFNSKVIRGSMGSFFRVKVIQIDSLENFLKNECRNFPKYGASPSANKVLHQISFPKNSVLVFGNESRGIRNSVVSLLDMEFRIEGNGEAESLNLSVSVGISLFHYFVHSNA